MRGTIGIRLHNTAISNATRQTLLPFSTHSGDGGRSGRGRGRGSGRGSSLSGLGPFNLNERVPGKPNSSGDPKSDSPDSPIPPDSSGRGQGHGRGKPLPSFSSFMSSIKQPPAGRGRATGPVAFQPEHDSPPPDSGPKKPIFFKREDDDVSQTDRTADRAVDHNLPESILGVLSGVGRGKPMKQPEAEAEVQPKEQNRHLRARRAPGGGAAAAAASSEALPGRQPIASRDDAVKNARKILSQGGEVEGSSSGSRSGRGRGVRERGGIGRGRGRGQGRGRFRVRDLGERGGQIHDTEDKYSAGLYVGDDADGEKLAKKLGPEIMNQLAEGFEEMAGRVLPSPLEDEYLDALDVNCAIEFEPEYLMGEFDRNPDIDEKEPIPLRDALEKMKPFLMAYEGIQSQEEWEEIMEETMERVPLLKKIVDHYSGPDRVTAKKQQEELERVAKTLPESAPSSVKQFTNRAVLSLQSNPGWGFDKKCQFMDKLVWEVSQRYK